MSRKRNVYIVTKREIEKGIQLIRQRIVEATSRKEAIEEALAAERITVTEYNDPLEELTKTTYVEEKESV